MDGGLSIALAAAAVGASAGSAVMQAQSVNASASLQAQQAAMRGEQAATELELAKLNQREQADAREQQAAEVRAASNTGAIAQGYDAFASPSFGALAAFNERQVAADISSISLLGNARRQRMMMEGRGAQMAEDYYSGVAANSWIAPTVGFIGSAAGRATGLMGGASGSSGGFGEYATTATGSKVPIVRSIRPA